jgi:flagellin-like hook-associated protein FlgL
VASETAVLSRNQVLQQASALILSQANIEGRVALELLR